MPEGREPDMLVVVDADPGSRAGLAIAARYAAGTAVLAAWEVAGSLDVDAEIRPSAAPEPTVAEALRMASARGIGTVSLRRDLAEPQDLLSQLLIGTARHADDDVPGFGVFLANGEPAPFRRILGIVDAGTAPVSGLAAHVAVSLADAAGAILDVIVIGPEGHAAAAADERELLAVNREQELFDQAVALAERSGLDVRFVPASGADQPWTLVRDQLGYREYDLVICGLGDVSLGPSLRRRAVIDELLAPGQVGQVPLRLLAETDLPLLVVLDEVRLGIAPSTLLRAGTVAALTIGMVGTAAVPASTTSIPVVAASTGLDQQPDRTPETVGEQLQVAIERAQAEIVKPESEPEPAQTPVVAAATGPDPLAEQASLDRAQDADDPSRSAGDGSGSRAVAEAASEGGEESEEEPEASGEPPKQPEPPEPPKGGADPADVRKAARQVGKAKEVRAEAKQEAAEAAEAVERANDEVAVAQAAAAVAAADLEAARLSRVAALEHAERTAAAAEGITSVLPGSPTPEDAALAQEVAELADERLEDALVRGEEVLADLAAAEDGIGEAEAALAEQQQAAAEARAEVRAAKERLEVYQESLAASRQSPVAKGSYRLTARFGARGGYWSGGVHTGLDFAGRSGTPITAAASGRVVSAGWEGAYGNRVVIDHGNGYRTTYNHLSGIQVRVGQQVQTGDRLGGMGATGNSTGNHLHFEVERDGQFVNPESWLGW
jgi:murein DD-endopeptidase MepM/ murein hydrolase activator NlpD